MRDKLFLFWAQSSPIRYLFLEATIRSVLGLVADSDLKQKIVERLIYKIEVLPKAVNIHYYVGQSHFVALGAGGKGPRAPGDTARGPTDEKRTPTFFFGLWFE